MDEKDPPMEPSHPWALGKDKHAQFDWDEERERQKTQDVRWTESDTEREERERSILDDHTS